MFKPKVPAPAAPPPPPPTTNVEIKHLEAMRPPGKPKKPAKPAKPPKPKPVAEEPPKPVVPKRPARFSRSIDSSGAVGPLSTFAPNPIAASSDGRLYTISLLQDKANLPPNVDPKRREMFLVDLEFMDVFGCTKQQWESKAEWQKSQLKKKAGLF